MSISFWRMVCDDGFEIGFICKPAVVFVAGHSKEIVHFAIDVFDVSPSVDVIVDFCDSGGAIDNVLDEFAVFVFFHVFTILLKIIVCEKGEKNFLAFWIERVFVENRSEDITLVSNWLRRRLRKQGMRQRL